MGPRSKNSPSRQMQLKRKAGWNLYSKEELQRKRIELIREKFKSIETFRLKQLERVDLNRKVCIRCARPDSKRAHDQTCFVNKAIIRSSYKAPDPLLMTCILEDWDEYKTFCNEDNWDRSDDDEAPSNKSPLKQPKFQSSEYVPIAALPSTLEQRDRDHAYEDRRGPDGPTTEESKDGATLPSKKWKGTISYLMDLTDVIFHAKKFSVFLHVPSLSWSILVFPIPLKFYPYFPLQIPF